MEIRQVGSGVLGDLRELFDGNATTRGCYCMWFLLSSKEVRAGWGAGNRDHFESLVAEGAEPFGVLANDDEGRPVGWCAVGPRARYSRVLRSPLMSSPLMREREPGDDGRTWFVPCFFVRVGARRAGITHQLLKAAVETARGHGATAIEGFPLAGAGPHRDDRYLGTEPLFAACGFEPLARPSERRVVMRLALKP